ncbi:hypothetical protein Athai_54250 [Actinocatenispora thailandica]|uniref:DUF4386 domain-containing protein n=2 Tax=Actinocatenispora thailandica TaxID=227318 RepID=A0A7R7DV65_9ACTN|nr:hypothetical protein Athai_54250 [Actinocatenispora thailandica]
MGARNAAQRPAAVQRAGPPAGTESYRLLYRVGGFAALASAALIPVQIAVFLAVPPPLSGTAVAWFGLLRAHPALGLVDLDLLLVVDNVLLVPLLLALYLTLRRAYPAAMLLAAAAGLMGALLYVASNPAIQLGRLAGRFVAADNAADRAAIRAAGEAALATWQGTGFQVAYLLGSLAGIVVGVVMLRTPVFSRLTGWMAIAGNVIGLGLYLPAVGVYVSVFSVLFLEVWYVLVGVRLVRLAGTR